MLLRYDMRPDRVGWTVYDVVTGRAVSLDADVPLIALELEDADELVDLLNGLDRQSARAATQARPACDLPWSAR